MRRIVTMKVNALPVRMRNKATPRLTEGTTVEQCVDPRLKGCSSGGTLPPCPCST